MSASTVYSQKYKSAADDNNVKEQDKKISKLASQLQKKQERLRELDDMRLAIRNRSL
jgi:septal ring factor EnvC (AmiA/AmiB activator)